MAPTILALVLATISLVNSWSNPARERSPVQLLIIPDTQPEFRLLSVADNADGIRIYGHYLDNALRSESIDAIRIVFSVATKYFQRVLRVTKLPQGKTKFPSTKAAGLLWFLGLSRSNPCTILVILGDSYASSQYRSRGFDQNSTDMVIFVDSENKPQESYVAYAMGCAFARRPTYGKIMFNSPYMSVRPLSQLHLSIQTTVTQRFKQMHELIHVLGFSDEYYPEYYVSPTSNSKRGLSNVIRSFGGRQMIVTPRVMQYVQEYFGCNDGVTGAMLEDQGGSGSRNSHWEKLIYRDEIMTPSSYNAGFKITQLTLALLQDTGFYQTVNYAFSDSVMWGYKKGCPFAQGKSPELYNDCKSDPQKSCDYYSKFIRYCEVEKFSDGVQIAKAFSNAICANSENQMSPPAMSNRFGYYGDDSRCLLTGTNNTPQCYRAACAQGSSNIAVTVGGDTQICGYPGQVLTIKGIAVYCPKDFMVFCSYKGCPNWCNGHGVCINGNCVCSPPWAGVGCLEGCPGLYEAATDSCVNQCSPNSFVLNRTCLSICPNGYVADPERQCQRCYNRCPGAVAKRQLRLAVFMLAVVVYLL